MPALLPLLLLCFCRCSAASSVTRQEVLSPDSKPIKMFRTRSALFNTSNALPFNVSAPSPFCWKQICVNNNNHGCCCIPNFSPEVCNMQQNCSTSGSFVVSCNAPDGSGFFYQCQQVSFCESSNNSGFGVSGVTLMIANQNNRLATLLSPVSLKEGGYWIGFMSLDGLGGFSMDVFTVGNTCIPPPDTKQFWK
jgi:hypothetical protein